MDKYIYLVDRLNQLEILLEVYTSEFYKFKGTEDYRLYLELKIRGYASQQQFIYKVLQDEPSARYEGLSIADELALSEYYGGLSEGLYA